MPVISVAFVSSRVICQHLLRNPHCPTGVDARGGRVRQSPPMLDDWMQVVAVHGEFSPGYGELSWR